MERRLPGFLPAVRLQGLVLTAMGKAESAQEVWERGLAACRDDEFLRCHATAIGAQVPQSSSIRVGAVTPMFGRSAAFGAGVLSVALVIGGISFWPARGAQLGGSTKAGALSASAAHLRGAPLNAMPPGSVVLGVALDGAVDSLAALIRMTGPDTALWSASSRRRAVSLLRRAGWDHYRSGIVALRAGNYGEATNELRLAVEYGRGDFFEDDALYALSGAYGQLGDKALASHAAIQLLETFPTSIFANSMTRRLARLSGRR